MSQSGESMGGIRQSAGATATSAGKSFISTVIARMPFSYQLIDRITELNPKYEVFKDLPSNRADRVTQQSVFRQPRPEDTPFGSIFSNKSYQELMYANIEMDKVKRLQDYRRMASYSKLADCLDEICDEVFVEDDHERLAVLKIPEQEYSKNIKEEIQKEFERFISNFDLESKGWNMIRSLLIDGEYFFENIISDSNPEYGVIGTASLPSELINPIYDNTQNDEVKGFLLRKPVINPKTQMIDHDEVIVLDKNQVTYIHSGLWNEDKTIRLSFLENSRRAYKQLSLIEDSIIIQRLVRAPERLVFKVDVGNMSPPKAEAYLKRLMQQYWTKKTYDVSTGRITNIYDPQSYLDAYFFAKRAGTEGTTVDTISSSQNFGNIDDLFYFVKELYRSLKIPRTRLNPEDGYKDGLEMTREELRFARFLIRIQKQIASALRQSFITHLKLRNMWNVFKLKERHLKIIFNTPTMFMTLKQQQIFDVKYNNFNNLSQNEGISNSFAQEKYLGLSSSEMARNREWRRRDAAFQYELEQIISNGPNWKEVMGATQQAAAEIGGAEGGGGGAAGGGGGGGGSALPPEFGPSPTGGEGAEGGAAPAGGAPAGGAAPETAAPAAGAAGGAAAGAAAGAAPPAA